METRLEASEIRGLGRSAWILIKPRARADRFLVSATSKLTAWNGNLRRRTVDNPLSLLRCQRVKFFNFRIVPRRHKRRVARKDVLLMERINVAREKAAWRWQISFRWMIVRYCSSKLPIPVRAAEVFFCDRGFSARDPSSADVARLMSSRIRQPAKPSWIDAIRIAKVLQSWILKISRTHKFCANLLLFFRSANFSSYFLDLFIFAWIVLIIPLFISREFF